MRHYSRALLPVPAVLFSALTVLLLLSASFPEKGMFVQCVSASDAKNLNCSQPLTSRFDADIRYAQLVDNTTKVDGSSNSFYGGSFEGQALKENYDEYGDREELEAQDDFETFEDDQALYERAFSEDVDYSIDGEDFDEVNIINVDTVPAVPVPADAYEDDLDLIDVPDDNAPIIDPNAESDGSAPGELVYVDRAEEELLIVEVVVGEDNVLDPGIIIYVDEDDTWLPLGIMTDLMQFPIDVDPGTGVADGWFLNPENTFTLSPPYTEMTLAGDIIDLNPDNVENHYDDIFVSQSVFEKWFPVRTILSLNDLRLYLDTEEDLPFQVLAKRRERWQQAERQSARPGFAEDEDVIKLPYKRFAPPTIRVNHNINGASARGVFTNTTSTTIQTQGDFLGMNLISNGSFTTASKGRNEFGNFNFTFTKEDYTDKLLGPLKATRFELGDVQANAIPLAVGIQRGRGATITNAPINFVRDPSDFIIEGFGPVDWDVELYQDDRLVDFQTINTDGRYLFDALPLRQGFNLFRIILYGPSGEKEERFERFYLGPSMVDKGKFIYEASLLESSTPLFDPSSSRADTTSGTISLQGDYGLTERLSVSGGVSRAIWR